MAVLLQESSGQRPSVQRRGFLDTMRVFLEFSGLISLLLYGLAWAQASRFYDSFGLDPEDVGIDLSWLLIRAIVASLPLSAFIVAVLGLDTARGYIPRTAYAGAIGLLSLFVIVLIGYILSESVSSQPPKSTVQVFAEVISTVLVVTCVLGAVHWRTSRSSWELTISVAAGLLGVVLIVGSAVRTSDMVADAVADGGIGTASALGLTAFRAEGVVVLNATGDNRLKPAFNDCATLFGVANGVIVLLRPHHEGGVPLVMRLPVEEFVIQRGCFFVQHSGGSPPPAGPP